MYCHQWRHLVSSNVNMEEPLCRWFRLKTGFSEFLLLFICFKIHILVVLFFINISIYIILIMKLEKLHCFSSWSFSGLCTSTCTSSAFWLRSPCIENTNPGNPLLPQKWFPPPPSHLHAQPRASLLTPTTMTKYTEKPLFTVFYQAFSSWCSLKDKWISLKGIQPL